MTNNGSMGRPVHDHNKSNNTVTACRTRRFVPRSIPYGCVHIGLVTVGVGYKVPTRTGEKRVENSVTEGAHAHAGKGL